MARTVPTVRVVNAAGDTVKMNEDEYQAKLDERGPESADFRTLSAQHHLATGMQLDPAMSDEQALAAFNAVRNERLAGEPQDPSSVVQPADAAPKPSSDGANGKSDEGEGKDEGEDLTDLTNDELRERIKAADPETRTTGLNKDELVEKLRGLNAKSGE